VIRLRLDYDALTSGKVRSGDLSPVISLALCLVTCLTTVLASMTLARSTVVQYPTSSAVRPPPRILPRRSPYVNADRLRELTRKFNHTFPPIDNVGPSSFQIAAHSANRTIWEDPSRMTNTKYGMIWPEDRHFQVNHQVCGSFLTRVSSFSDSVARPPPSTSFVTE
jgi:hypothetical protein